MVTTLQNFSKGNLNKKIIGVKANFQMKAKGLLAPIACLFEN